MNNDNIFRELNNIGILLISTCCIILVGIQFSYAQTIFSFDSHNLGIKFELQKPWWHVSLDPSDPKNCFTNNQYDCPISLKYDKYPGTLGYEDSIAEVIIFKKPYNGSLIDYVRKDFGEYHENLQTYFKDYKFINDNETTIGGYPAIQMEFSYRDRYIPTSLLDEWLGDPSNFTSLVDEWLIYIKVNNSIYEFSYYNFNTEYTELIPSLKQLINSIEFYTPLPYATDSDTKKPSFLN